LNVHGIGPLGHKGREFESHEDTDIFSRFSVLIKPRCSAHSPSKVTYRMFSRLNETEDCVINKNYGRGVPKEETKML
jgi:hypothetical protein